MSKYRDPLTKDLFSWEPPKVAVGYGSDVTGRGPLDSKIARLIGHAVENEAINATTLEITGGLCYPGGIAK